MNATWKMIIQIIFVVIKLLLESDPKNGGPKLGDMNNADCK